MSRDPSQEGLLERAIKDSFHPSPEARARASRFSKGGISFILFFILGWIGAVNASQGKPYLVYFGIAALFLGIGRWRRKGWFRWKSTSFIFFIDAAIWLAYFCGSDVSGPVAGGLVFLLIIAFVVFRMLHSGFRGFKGLFHDFFKLHSHSGGGDEF